MPTPSKRFMNWENVQFSPDNGDPIVFTGVKSVTIDPNASMTKFAGDNDRYYTTVVNDMNDPTITVISADLAAIRACPPGTRGTFSATHNDAKNGSGAGAITYHLARAVVASTPIHGTHREFGGGTITFISESLDGVTNPISVSTAG